MTAPHRDEHRGPVLWLALAVGWVVMGYGIVGLLDASAATRPGNLAAFFLGAGIVHDAVVAPVVVGVGWLVARLLPTWVRAPVWFGLAASGLLLAFSWPLVRGWGRREANPSLLPLDYGRNLVLALVVIWALAAFDIGRRILQRRRAR